MEYDVVSVRVVVRRTGKSQGSKSVVDNPITGYHAIIAINHDSFAAIKDIAVDYLRTVALQENGWISTGPAREGEVASIDVHDAGGIESIQANVQVRYAAIRYPYVLRGTEIDAS